MGVTTNWVVCFWIEKLAIAVERRRLPDTDGEPLALIDPNGLIQVASDEAKHWAVAAGMTNQAGRGLCGELRVFPYDRPSYEIAARPIWDLIATESDVVEPASPEICYAEVCGSQTEVIARMSRLTELAAPIIDLPICIGIARSKFVALRAAQHRMMDGPFLIPLGEETKFLSHAPIESVVAFLPKLDLKSRKQLERLSVKTLGDVWSLSPQRLPKALQKTGYQVLQLAQGFDSDPVRALWPPRTIVVLVSFTEESEDGGGYSDGVSDLLVVENRLVKMAEAISVSLAVSREYTREIGLKVGLRDGSFFGEIE